jgi:drug/metabolite transporter (DMT)-like permease
MNTHSKGLLITTVGTLLVVPDSLFVRLIDADPLVIAFWRGMLSGVGILIGVLALQGRAPFRALKQTGRYGVIYVITLGISGTLFIVAVGLTSIANVVFIIASMPVFASIYSRIFLKEPISPRMIVTMAAVFCGLAIIAYGSGESQNSWWVGDLVALAVSATFAAGLTAARRVRDVSMVPAVPIAYIGAALVLWPFVDPLMVPVDQMWLVLVHGGFIIRSATCLALGPRYITSADVAVLILLESVLAPLLAWAIVGEDPGAWALAGGGVVVSALVLSNLVVMMRRRKAAASG